MGSSTITLYHYTSEEAKKAIKDLKIIKSSKGEAHFGDGVYFTDMSTQDFTKTEVSRNNYRYPNAKKKLEYCIIVTMPKDKVKKCKTKRRVFLHKGDVNLEDEGYYYKIEKSRFKEDQTTQNASGFQQGGATAMPSDIDVKASSYELHTWLSSF